MNQEIKLAQTNQACEKQKLEHNENFSDKKNGDVITTVGAPQYFCVGIVDIINFTKTVAKIETNKVPQYYEIFLNNMAKIVNSQYGEILKIMGDSLLFYFPETCHSHKSSFLNAVDCGFSMMVIHEKLNQILEKYDLPQIDFRISFDYGNVTVMRTRNGLIDLVGPTINTCAKINDLASTNGMVIGRNLYEKLKHFNEYSFKKIKNFCIDLKYEYPVFIIYKK